MGGGVNKCVGKRGETVDETELKRKGYVVEEQKASCLGTTVITADAKTLWMHLRCLMETSQPALKPLRGGWRTCTGCVCVCVFCPLY